MNLSEQFPDLMLPVKVVWLTQGKFAIVDPEDYETVTKAASWSTKPHGRTFYARGRLRGEGRLVSLHQFISGHSYVDHKNGNGLDNRRSNLRSSTALLNARNQRIPKSNTSGFRGVSFHSGTSKWRAQVQRNGRGISLGLYVTPEEASQAYEMFLREEGYDAQ